MNLKGAVREEAMTDVTEYPAVITTNELLPAELDALADAEQRIGAAIEQAATDIGDGLRAIRDGRLHRQTHATFAAYVSERWGFSDRRARQLIDFARVREVLAATGTTVPLPTNERQARGLVGLIDDPDVLLRTWETGGKPQLEPPPPPMTRAEAEAFSESVGRQTQQLADWLADSVVELCVKYGTPWNETVWQVHDLWEEVDSRCIREIGVDDELVEVMRPLKNIWLRGMLA